MLTEYILSNWCVTGIHELLIIIMCLQGLELQQRLSLNSSNYFFPFKLSKFLQTFLQMRKLLQIRCFFQLFFKLAIFLQLIFFLTTYFFSSNQLVVPLFCNLCRKSTLQTLCPSKLVLIMKYTHHRKVS